jgi:hypothetical protein
MKNMKGQKIYNNYNLMRFMPFMVFYNITFVAAFYEFIRFDKSTAF